MRTGCNVTASMASPDQRPQHYQNVCETEYISLRTSSEREDYSEILATGNVIFCQLICQFPQELELSAEERSVYSPMHVVRRLYWHLLEVGSATVRRVVRKFRKFRNVTLVKPVHLARAAVMARVHIRPLRALRARLGSTTTREGPTLIA